MSVCPSMNVLKVYLSLLECVLCLSVCVLMPAVSVCPRMNVLKVYLSLLECVLYQSGRV